MSVKDFMVKNVVYISPDTTIAHAADMMREQQIHRLPVIENDRLVGLVTESTIAAASPSKATSLSIYEMNYLLNKTKARDVMIKDVLTISKEASLEDAVYLMYKHKVGILPVVDEGAMSGIITDRDIFKAFLAISAYGQAGVRLRFLVKDEKGTLEKILKLIADADFNVVSTVNIPHKKEGMVIEIQLAGPVEVDGLLSQLAAAGYPVADYTVTQTKAI